MPCFSGKLPIILTFCLLPISAYSAQVDLFRFYSPDFQSHFYTTHSAEKSNLVTRDPHWQFEGSIALAESTLSSEVIPIYRFWSDNYQSHFYTSSDSERDNIISNDKNWSYENVAYYAYTQAAADRTAVFRFWHNDRNKHFYTTSVAEKNALLGAGYPWQYEGVPFYLPKNQNAGTLLYNDFSFFGPGDYSNDHFLQDTNWSGVTWADTNSRSMIISESSDNKLRVTYPAGSVESNDSGIQSLIPLGNNHTELYFRQSVRFEPGFDWRRGGKLPGLTSGGTTWTGGNAPRSGEGFSARYMWRDGGRAIIYLYHADQATSFGDEIDLGFSFVTGVDYTITQRIKRNTGDQIDGILEVWVSENGGPHTKVLSHNGYRFGLGSGGYIDSLYFSTYFGGSDSSWAPLTDSYATFDDFIVTQSRFSDLP